MPRKPKAKEAPVPGQSSIFDLLLKSQEARETVKAMLKIKAQPDVWRGLVATPPGSLLATVVAAFRSTTDIPLEIPFFATLHFLAAHLLARGVTVQFVGQTVRPDLWSIVLADSGSGKTFATNILEKFIDQDSTFPEPASAAKFIEDLSTHNNSLWVRDEFAQFLKALEQQPHMAEIRDYLLRVYDGKRVERNTKKQSITVEDPALCILGMTVLKTFKEAVSAESMLDGFAQRFSYIIAKRDPSRLAKDYPIYDMQAYQDRIRSEWLKVVASISEEKYVVGPDGEAAFRESFAMLLPPNEEIPMSFFRRIMFRGVRYALLYHILLGKPGATIDAVDMGWAGRICGLHIHDAAWVIGEHGLPDLERLCKRAEELKQRILKEEGRSVTARDVVRNIHGIRNTNEARAILQMI